MAIPIGILSQGAGGLGYWLARTDNGGYATNWSADLGISDSIVLASSDTSPRQIAIRRIDKNGVVQVQYGLTRDNYVDPIDIAVGSNMAYVLNFNSSSYLNWEIIKCGSIGFPGYIEWQKKFAGSTAAYDIVNGGSIGTDSAGSVYVTGEVYVYAATPYNANLLLKYNSSGTFQFAKIARITGQNVFCPAIATNDSLTDVYVAGGTGGIQGLLIKYTSAGAISWARQFTSGDGIGVGVDWDACAVSSAGDIYVCFSGSNLSTGVRDTTLAKYNSSGTLQWQRKTATSIGGDRSVKIGSDGFIYLSTNAGRIFKFDSSGNLIWKRIITGMTYNNSPGVFVTSLGTFFFPGQVGVLYAPTDGTTGPITGYSYGEETDTTWGNGNGTSASVTLTASDLAGTTTDADFAIGSITDTITKIDW